MNSNKFSALVIVLVVVFAGLTGYYVYNSLGLGSREPYSPAVSSNPPASNQPNNPSGSPVQNLGQTSTPANQPSAKTWRVEYKDGTFTPASLTVKKGDKVTWVNKNATNFWPASAMHPTHKVYPGSDIEKCGTVEASKIFDACRSIAQGGEYSFVFNEVGSWKYHDHMKASAFGAVEVAE